MFSDFEMPINPEECIFFYPIVIIVIFVFCVFFGFGIVALS